MTDRYKRIRELMAERDALVAALEAAGERHGAEGASMIFWTLTLGQYNLASTEDVWCLALRTPYGQVSETFPKDNKPEVDPEGTTPSEVLDLIEARLDSYWISTRRAETKAKIAEIRQHSNEIDAAWLDQKIEQTEDKLRIMRRNRAALEPESEQ